MQSNGSAASTSTSATSSAASAASAAPAALEHRDSLVVVPPPPPRPVVEPPLWVSTFDPSTDDIYYINTKTNEVTWDRPADFSGIMVGTDGRPLDVATTKAREARALAKKRLSSHSATSGSPPISPTGSPLARSRSSSETDNTNSTGLSDERRAARKAAAKRRLSIHRQGQNGESSTDDPIATSENSSSERER